MAGADRTLPRAPRGDQRPPIRSFGISGKALLLRSFLGISASETAHSFPWTSRLACFPLVSVPISQGHLSCSMLETSPPTPPSRSLGIRCGGQYSVEDIFLKERDINTSNRSLLPWLGRHLISCIKSPKSNPDKHSLSPTVLSRYMTWTDTTDQNIWLKACPRLCAHKAKEEENKKKPRRQ
jgi:hypothetical protein